MKQKRESISIDMPRVDILLSIYKPNLTWFKEQLESLDALVYENLHLLIWNDCPKDNFDYTPLLQQCLHNLTYKYINEHRNLGAAKAFEYLTSLSTAELVAYCDQDDIWLPEKIQEMATTLLQEDADLVCCDQKVIDGDGNLIANYITEVRPKQKFCLGEQLQKYIVTANYVSGCASLVKRKVALKAFPVLPPFYHDWWITLYVVAYGKIAICRKSLIKYRIHGNNQTGFLAGINTKEDYFKGKINECCDRIAAISERFSDSRLGKYIPYYNAYASCRREYYLHPSIKGALQLWRYREENFLTVCFELLLPIMPNLLFAKIIQMLRKRQK